MIVGMNAEIGRAPHPHPSRRHPRGRGPELRSASCACQIAAEIGVPCHRISEIVRARRGVRFRTSPQFWLNVQNAHDLSKARATADYSAVRAREAEPAATS